MVVYREDENVFEHQNYVNEAVAELTKPTGDKTKVMTATSACVKGYRREAVEAGRLFFGPGYHVDVFPWLRFPVENPRLRIGCAPAAVYYRTIRRQSDQITENPSIIAQQLADLNLARQTVIELLRHNNQGGAYDTLIARYEELIAADTGPVQANGAQCPT